MVCKSTLKKIANEIELEKYVKHSKKVDSLESIKANALEALIGAIYLDSNLEKTTTVILSLWKNYFDNINLSSFDPKSSLQEWCLKYKKKLPEYKLIEKIGPDHQPTFKIKVFIDNHTYSSANGNSKQDAEINAAEKLLKKISEKKKSSNILITGFPNVGKSSLINFLLKRKISIVSSKVQTTNENIQAVLNHNDCQMIFVDTPGIINKKKFYSKKLSREIFKNTEQIDINLFVYDVTKKLTTLKLKKINETISTFKKNYLILNKIDLVKNDHLLQQIEQLNKKICFTETFPVSVKKKIGIENLLEMISKISPYRDWKFNNNNKDIINKDLNFILSEITREKIFNLLNKELPYVIKIKSLFKKEKNMIVVEQRIIVEKESQKAIIIGQGGSKIKDIGSRSRVDMEKVFKKKVFLDLRVIKN